jgi:hypothetical protein
MLAVALGLLLQIQPLELTTSLDRSRVMVGEEFLFTLRVIGHSTAPFRVELPALDGLAIVDRSERTDVVVGTAQTTRAYTLQLRLRAEQVGSWSIAPIRVEQGTASAFSSVESVTVTNVSSANSGLDQDLLALLLRVPAPRPGQPSVFTLASAARVFVGDQLNVLTGAWLPRGLRLRMRQPPTLTPPALSSVWATPRRPVAGAVASRVVEGESYDLYVSFQTAYPLNPGSLLIPPARLGWVQPGRQYLSPEQRESVESASLGVAVQPLPDAGRPAGFDGPIARELRIEYELGASSARAGAVLPVAVVVSGAGNLPLWPAPRIAWPASVRVYQEATEDLPRVSGVRIGGSKRFRFSIVPDSAGSLSLPALEYAYFDPVPAAYRLARAAAIVVPVLEAAPIAQRRNPLPLEVIGTESLAERLVHLPPLALGALVALPLLAMAGLVLRGRLKPRPAPPRALPAPPERLDALLALLVPPDTPAVPRALTRALRAAGLDRREAERLVRLHFALEADRFGPEASRGDAPSGGEIEAALTELPRLIRGAGSVAVLGLLAVSAAFPARSVAQSGLELYTRGDYPAAARALRQEAALAPPRAARWYDLAAAEYLANRDADAVAALLLARAHAPRDRHVQALWNALAREHEQLRRAGRRWPLSAEECFALALLALWLGAVLFLVLRRQRTLWAAALGLAAALALLGLGLRAERSGPRAVLAGGATLRTSPHGLAPERGAVPGFSIVRLERQLGGWWLIRTADGAEGWVPAEILARSPALD